MVYVAILPFIHIIGSVIPSIRPSAKLSLKPISVVVKRVSVRGIHTWDKQLPRKYCVISKISQKRTHPSFTRPCVSKGWKIIPYLWIFLPRQARRALTVLSFERSELHNIAPYRTTPHRRKCHSSTPNTNATHRASRVYNHIYVNVFHHDVHRHATM